MSAITGTVADPGRAEMKNKARKDIHYFSLLWLAFKTRGRLFTSKHFGANALLANQYDNVDVSEFIQKMKLNERITLDKYIPYSSHIHPYVIRNRHRDLVATGNWAVQSLNVKTNIT